MRVRGVRCIGPSRCPPVRPRGRRSKAKGTGRGGCIRALTVGEPTRRGQGGGPRGSGLFPWPEGFSPEALDQGRYAFFNGLFMHVKIYVTYKNGVLDPQGKAVERSLHTLGYREVQGVRMGKYLEVNLDTHSRKEAEARIREMCERLLANPVIEDYRFEIQE